ncbi:hypothetical protein GH808_00760 [Acetobacterium fimetarium]|uniref:SF3 helicase domain-containing protein n=1 Tax=Acetobacterium fimetarium TaxID=52691 RepID=A0ABR6WR36_9FIRM|nr:phage/plasmid primase, P4 family [Acetobacterium fimetarium]MBC3802973.1 hypothetical protein [Acetobacterium fimetarium]
MNDQQTGDLPENLVAVAVTAADFLSAFHEGPYCLRTFSDRGSGRGKNYTVDSGGAVAFAAVMAELHRVNQNEQRGVFFVVNRGGHRDEAITRVTAHFVEADDLSLGEQYANLMAFALPPSIIVQTRKSLHGYWLIKPDGAEPEVDRGPLPAAAPVPEDERGTLRVSAQRMTSRNVPLSSEGNGHLAAFRSVQKKLAAHFGGDPVIANPSRVMRLPGFNHTKQEPVPVRCLLFAPERRYTQAELLAALPCAKQPGAAGTPAKTGPSGPTAAAVGAGAGPDSRWVLTNCTFIKHCQDHAAGLSEPLWYAMITNLADTSGGAVLIHALSRPDPRYDKSRTDAKISQARGGATGPISCQTIRDWGFACPGRDACPAQCPRDLGVPPLAPWYQKQPRGLRLMTGILADCLSRDKDIIYTGEAYYQFIKGVYTMVDDNHIKRIIRNQLLVNHVNMGQIKDVQGQLTLLIARSAEKLNPCRHRINLQNGLFDLRSGALAPHDPGYLSTIQIGTRYDPAASAPRFTKFLSQCLDADTRVLVQEIFGYLLIPETCAQKAFVLVGEGGAGKSTLLWVAQELLLGPVNVSNIPWQSLDDRFKTAELFGKLANIFADLPSRSIEDNGLFKSITGEDRITAERKNKDPFAFVATARLLFSCNAIPKNLGDRSDAFYRRLVIVPFQPARPQEQRDPKLKQHFVAEAPGIFNWALAGLKRLVNNDYRFSESHESQAALSRYRIDGSSVLTFVAELCVVAADAQASSTQLYHAYVQYCKDTGLKAVSQKRFAVELEAAVTGLEKYRDSRSRRTVYKGIRLDEADCFECS